MKSTSPPLAKITRPTLPEVFPRPRLFRALDHARNRPLVWITGPPGAGKTTLVASYLAARKSPALWYQVDAGDADPATFFYYLGLAAKRAAPRYRTALPLLTPEYLSGLEVFTHRFLQLLYERLPEGCVLVLDNYQAAPLDTPFHEVIRYSFDAIPKGSGVIVISRSDPPPSLARLRAAQSMEVIDGEALRATPQETRGIARLKHPLSDKTIRALHETTGGWAAGIILMAQRASLGESAAQDRPENLTKEVFDYFAGEIFERTDPQVREFLLQTVFLPKMTVRIVEGLTGLQRSGRILSELNRQNYFTERRGNDPPVYQYHALFQKYLLDRAGATWTPVVLSQVRHRAATVLEQAGQIEDAVNLFREAGDWAGVARLAISQAPAMVSQGRHVTLEGWLTALPPSVIEENPWLLYWMGACRLPFNPPLSRGYFERAFDRFSEKQDDMGSLLAWSGAVNSILFEWGDLSRLDRWIDWLHDRMRRDLTFPSLLIEASVICDMVQALSFRNLGHPEILSWVERAVSLYQKISDPNFRINIALKLIHHYIWKGQIGAAREMVKEIERLEKLPGVSPFFLIMGKWATGLYYLVINSYDRCLKAIPEGLNICRTSGIRLGEGVLFIQGFYSALGNGDLKTAREYLDKMEAATDPNRQLDMAHNIISEGVFELHNGRTTRAIEHLEKSIVMLSQLGVPFLRTNSHLYLALALHKHGAHQRAVRHLEIAHRASRRLKSRLMEYLCLLARAHFAFESDGKGLDARSLRVLRDALRLGREEGYIDMPGWPPLILVKLFTKALEHDIEPDYVRQIIRKRHFIPDASLAGNEQWPWPLKIYTLGRFSLVMDGKPVRFAVRGQGKVLELLKVLIALGSREVDQARLSETLWPDAEGDRANQVFKTTLHRLRKLLGNDEVISVREGQVSLDPRYCWVDVWAFERLLGGDKLDPAAVEKVVALYQGRFLGQDAVSSWAMALRERLHAKYLRRLSDLGHRWEAAGEWDKAVGIYQRGLGVDPLVEEYYQRLMVCHQRQGHRAEAASVYRRCCEALRMHLDIAPSPETEAIGQSIHGSVNP